MNTFIFFLCLILTSSLFSTTSDPWQGEEYAKHSQSQQNSAIDFIQELQLSATSAILDIGCGDGKITASFAKSIPKGSVIGIDISPSMIQTAKTTFSDWNNLTFELQDASNIHFDNQFDLITSFTVMHWVLNQSQALKSFAKALKAEGKLYIQMPIGLPTSMEEALKITLAKHEWASYFSNFSAPWKFYQPNEYRELLINAHLNPIKLEVVKKHEFFPSRALFHDFLKQWFPYLRTLPIEKKDLFLSELLDTYLKIQPIDNQGRVSFIVDRLEVIATKQGAK